MITPDTKTLKFIVIAILSVIAILLIVATVRGVHNYFEDRKLRKNYEQLQKEYDEQKELLKELNETHQDSIDDLKRDNLMLRDTLSILNKEVNRLEDAKPKIIYRISNMSISEQQEYFTDRYREGRSPRLNNRSSGNSRLGVGRSMLRTASGPKSSSAYLRARYG